MDAAAEIPLEIKNENYREQGGDCGEAVFSMTLSSLNCCLSWNLLQPTTNATHSGRRITERGACQPSMWRRCLPQVRPIGNHVGGEAIQHTRPHIDDWPSLELSFNILTCGIHRSNSTLVR